MNRLHILLVAGLLLGQAQGVGTPTLDPSLKTGALLSVIDIDTTFKDDLNRAPMFVELRDLGGREREYSVPYVADYAVRNFAQDAGDNWKIYQDSMHWAMQVALNNDLLRYLPHASVWPPTVLPPLVIPNAVDDYTLNCDLKIPADLQIELTQSVTGKTWIPTEAARALPAAGTSDLSNPRGVAAKALPLKLSDPLKTGNWENDDTGLEYVLAPRVTRDHYCQGTDANFMPDFVTPGWPGNVYEPAILVNGTNWNIFNPSPLNPVTQWGVLYARVDQAANTTHLREYKDYQVNTATSLVKNMPLAIQWSGAFLPTSGTRSGHTLVPFYSLPALPAPGTTPKLTDHDQDIVNLVKADKKNALLLPYLNGIQLPTLSLETTGQHRPGDIKLEDLKRKIRAGTFQQQQKEGMATFFHTWMQLDSLVDARPLVYWVPTYTCTIQIFPPAIPCVPVPTPVPYSGVAVTPAGSKSLTTNAPGTGSTVFSTYRYRYGTQTTPEGQKLPDLDSWHPTARPGKE